MTPEMLGRIRTIVMGELARIAAFEDGSPELKELNDRILNRVTESERQLANFVNTPPSWGARGTGSVWMDQLRQLERTPDFRKSVTLRPQLERVRALLSSGKNIWAESLTKWQLAGVTPYATAARPSPALLEREEKERIERAENETRRLARLYEIEDLQEALRKYQQEQDAAAALIEEEAKSVAPPSFVENPPMTLDDELRFAQKKLASSVPMVVSTFENMSSATAGFAFDLHSIPASQLRYVSLLPALLTRVGVIENGRAVSFEEMSERLRKEILRLDAYTSTNPRTGRVELMVRGAGLGAGEATRALEWMSLVLHHPDWRAENLGRLRDLVDQQLSGLRNTMQQSEESWVNNPANAYRLQTDPHYLAAESFLTRTHNALRLRWLLREAPAADREELAVWFTELAERTASRGELKALAASPETVARLSESARRSATDVLKDLDLALIEIPDSSLAADWKYLVTAIRDDLFTPPAAALEQLHAVRTRLLHRDNSRVWLVGSSALQKVLEGRITALARSLSEEPVQRAGGGSLSHVDARLRAREEEAVAPVHVGLLAPNMKGGVIITAAPGVHFSDFDDKERQLDYLAGRLHSGYGAHGVFLKTLAAGLAYSNGLRASVQTGRNGYYAERTPEIPQTVKFVIETLKNAERDPRLADYAVAQVFGESRAASTYENRAEAMANDIVDGQTPDQVRRFRQSILELRKTPELGATLFDRKDAVYGRLLPGYNVTARDVTDGLFFAIGPDKQLDAWETYLAGVEGEDSKFHRLYPRDFWMP
ncbi:MAG TPA: hypothetical protein VF701_06640 [Thermoanaerobaculia bacterium]